MPRLRKEGGITRISLDNGGQLRKVRGMPVRVELRAEGEFRVVAMYTDGSRHVFKGFSWGYRGEGPQGLAEWCHENGIPLTFEDICALPQGDLCGVVYVWPEWGKN
jgi:hypothetical protein